MEVSSACIINENFDGAKFCSFENISPISIEEYPSFTALKDTTKNCDKKSYWNTPIQYCSSYATFICIGIVWTLAIIVLTICILIFMNIL